MSTQQDPYESEVKRIAEILASIHNPLAYPIYNKKRGTKEYKERHLWCIDQEMNAARMMVAEMEQVARAVMENSGMYQDWEVEERLIESGLIPPTKTTDNA